MMQTQTTSFETTLPALKEAYETWKLTEVEKNLRKSEFFTLADLALEQGGSAMKVVEITAESEESAVERAKRHHSDWLIDEHRAHPWKPGVYEIVVKENPTYRPFAIEHDGVKYARTVSRGPVMLDEEWLSQEDPALYADVTFELPWGAIVAVPLDQLAPEVVARLRKYIYNDKPRVSLAAPRPVTPVADE